MVVVDKWRVRSLRKKQGKTLEDVGDAMGLHKTTISRWERTGDVPLERIEDLAAELGVAVEELELSPMPAASDHVKSEESFHEWMQRVRKAGNLGHTKALLFTVAAYLDAGSWVAPISKEALQEAGHDAADVEAHWHALLDSEWLEKVGDVGFVFRLKFPS